MGLEVVDAKVDQVVDELNVAYSEDTGFSPGIVVDYILIYATRRYDDDGKPLTAYGLQWPGDNRTSHYAALGLIEYAAEKIRRGLVWDDDE